MAEVILTKSDDGRLVGLTDADEKRWAKFKSRAKLLEKGDTVRANFKLPRSPKFHKLHFGILAALFKCQEQFQDFEKFREWTQIGAGFCDIVPGPHGKPAAISRSIAWDALEDADFSEHHTAVMAFVRSVHFSRFLWPHLSDAQQMEMVESILVEFTV